MATPAEQIVLIDAKLAEHPEIDAKIPPNTIPDTNRIVSLMEASTRLLQKAELRKPHIRHLMRIRELLSRTI